MSWSRENRTLVEQVEGMGFTVTLTKRGHLKLEKDGLSSPVFLPSKLPTDRHRMNALAQVRRALRTETIVA